MPKPKHTLDEPRRAAAQAALARRQLEIRTLSTLQDHFPTDITRKIVNILNGNSPEHELPQKDARRVANRGGLTSGYKGATKSKNKWKASITRCGATVNLGSYDDELRIWRETCSFSRRWKCVSRHVPNSCSSVARQKNAGGGNRGCQSSTESKMRRLNLEATMSGASGQVAPNSMVATLSVSHSLLPHAASSKKHARQAFIRQAAPHPSTSIQRTCQSWCRT